MTNDNIVEMLKLNLTKMNRKLGSEQMSLIKHQVNMCEHTKYFFQLTEPNCSVLLGQTLLDELLETGGGSMTGGIDGSMTNLFKQNFFRTIG